jgi:AraC-like DNA-binding protein
MKTKGSIRVPLIMFVSSNHKNNYVTRGHFVRNAGLVPNRTFTPELDLNANVLRGNIGHVDLQPGLFLHFADTEDQKDLTIENLCKPGLVLSIFLQGGVEASIGGIEIPMPSYDTVSKSWQAVSSLRAHSVPQRFVRNGRRGDRLRKVNITMTSEWLDELACKSGEDFKPVMRFAEERLRIESWSPSAHSIALAEQILSAPAAPDFHRRLYLESRALDLVAEALSRFSDAHVAEPKGNLRQHDRARLSEIERVLISRSGEAISAFELSTSVGLSLNALRRLIMTARGMPPGRYIRTFMLEIARQAMERDGASIAEAAYLAGYTSPGNFTTAFKRCFGICPSSLSENR